MPGTLGAGAWGVLTMGGVLPWVGSCLPWGWGAENAEPELGLGPTPDLGVFGEAEPRKSENHLGEAAGGWPQ